MDENQRVPTSSGIDQREEHWRGVTRTHGLFMARYPLPSWWVVLRRVGTRSPNGAPQFCQLVAEAFGELCGARCWAFGPCSVAVFSLGGNWELSMGWGTDGGQVRWKEKRT